MLQQVSTAVKSLWQLHSKQWFGFLTCHVVSCSVWILLTNVVFLCVLLLHSLLASFLFLKVSCDVRTSFDICTCSKWLEFLNSTNAHFELYAVYPCWRNSDYMVIEENCHHGFNFQATLVLFFRKVFEDSFR